MDDWIERWMDNQMDKQVELWKKNESMEEFKTKKDGLMENHEQITEELTN